MREARLVRFLAGFLPFGRLCAACFFVAGPIASPPSVSVHGYFARIAVKATRAKFSNRQIYCSLP